MLAEGRQTQTGSRPGAPAFFPKMTAPGLPCRGPTRPGVPCVGGGGWELPCAGRVPDAAGFSPLLAQGGWGWGVEGYLDGAAEDFCAW